MDKKRRCAYCGIEKSFPEKYEERCKCAYRYGRRQKGFRGGYAVQCSNISAETTLDEMMESIRQTLSVSLKKKKEVFGVWKWSFSGRGKPEAKKV